MDESGWKVQVTKAGKVVGVVFNGVLLKTDKIVYTHVLQSGRLTISMPVYPGNPVQFVEVANDG